MGAAGGGLLGDRVEGVGEGMGGSGRGNLAGGRGGRGEHFWPEKNFALIIALQQLQGREEGQGEDRRQV